VAAISYVANAFGAPPPSAGFLARFSLGVWLFPFWAWWFDAASKGGITGPENTSTVGGAAVIRKTTTSLWRYSFEPSPNVN